MDAEPKKRYGLIIGGLVIVIALLLAGLLYSLYFMERGEEGKVVEDDTPYIQQIDSLKEQNQILAEKLAGLEGLGEEDQLYQDVKNFFELYQSNDLFFYDMEENDNQRKAQLADLCTDAALERMFPEKDYSYIREPIPYKPSDPGYDDPNAEQRYYPNYHYVTTVGTPKLYFRQIDQTHEIVLAFVPRHQDKSFIPDLDDEEMTFTTDDVYLANMQFVYDAQRNRWLADEVYYDTIYTGEIDSFKN